MENFLLEEIKKYVNSILNTNNISNDHLIQFVDNEKSFKIIQISPSIYLLDIITVNKKTFKSYVKQILDSVFNDYTIYVDHLEFQFNDSVIWIVYSYTLGNDPYLSQLPEEILHSTLLNSSYKEIKRFCQTSKEYAKV